MTTMVQNVWVDNPDAPTTFKRVSCRRLKCSKSSGIQSRSLHHPIQNNGHPMDIPEQLHASLLRQAQAAGEAPHPRLHGLQNGKNAPRNYVSVNCWECTDG